MNLQNLIATLRENSVGLSKEEKALLVSYFCVENGIEFDQIERLAADYLENYSSFGQEYFQ